MSAPERFEFESDDGLAIACVKWGNFRDVRGVLQIAHGLGEHIGRYAELAETLAQAEFVVYGNDHRGHGLTAKPAGSFGEFGPGGFDQLVEDMVSLRVIASRSIRANRTSCLATAWVLSRRSNLFSTIAIQLMVLPSAGPGRWMAWLALLNRYRQGRTR